MQQSADSRASPDDPLIGHVGSPFAHERRADQTSRLSRLPTLTAAAGEPQNGKSAKRHCWHRFNGIGAALHTYPRDFASRLSGDRVAAGLGFCVQSVRFTALAQAATSLVRYPILHCASFYAV